MLTNEKTDTWTGLTGEADQTVRNIGRKFWVFEGVDEFRVTDNIEIANKWHDEYENGDGDDLQAFLIMFAMNEEKAKELFFDAQDQWRAYQDGVVDFLGVVNSHETNRPIDPKRKLTYDEWAKEMETQYEIAC